MKLDLRPSPIAGTWYPGDPETLRRSVDRQLERADADCPAGEVVGLLAPHAGHQYSGPIAGYAFRCVRGTRPEVVAIVSPLHHPHRGQVFTTGHEGYVTPLGAVPVAQARLAAFERLLREAHGIPLQRIRFDQEHSLEIELPFLQRALEAPFTVLPLMLRDQSAPVARAVGAALAQALHDRPAILVASSDLSHYYPADEAKVFDEEILRRLEAFDPEGVLEAEEQGKGFACGKGAIAAVLVAARARGADRVRVLRYGTSGDVTRDDRAVVGYAAAVIYRSAEAAPASTAPAGHAPPETR